MKTNLYDITKSITTKQFFDMFGNVLHIGDIVVIVTEDGLLELKAIYYISNKYIYVANIESKKTIGIIKIQNSKKILCVNDFYIKNNLKLPTAKYLKHNQKYLFILHNKINNQFMIILLHPKYITYEYINEMLIQIFYRYFINSKDISKYIIWKDFSYKINKITSHTNIYNYITKSKKYKDYENKLYLIEQITDNNMVLTEYNTQRSYSILKTFANIPISRINSFIKHKLYKSINNNY